MRHIRRRQPLRHRFPTCLITRLPRIWLNSTGRTSVPHLVEQLLSELLLPRRRQHKMRPERAKPKIGQTCLARGQALATRHMRSLTHLPTARGHVCARAQLVRRRRLPSDMMPGAMRCGGECAGVIFWTLRPLVSRRKNCLGIQAVIISYQSTREAVRPSHGTGRVLIDHLETKSIVPARLMIAKLIHATCVACIACFCTSEVGHCMFILS